MFLAGDNESSKTISLEMFIFIIDAERESSIWKINAMGKFWWSTSQWKHDSNPNDWLS